MKLKVEFLNTYMIILDDEHYIDYNTINSPKLAKLLAYIIYHYRRRLSSNDLQELMFGDGESNNPANALKALIYRLRKIFKNNLGDADFILSSHGLYFWNPEIELDFDVDRFNTYYRIGRNEIQDPAIRADYYQQAFYYYHGKFLPMIENVEKLLIIRSYLNSQFLNIARFLIEFYLVRKDYCMVEEVCLAALVDNHLDENINLSLILALVKQDKITSAKGRYDKIIGNLKHDFSDATIRKMRYYLNLNNEDSEEKNIDSIQDDLIEPSSEGPYLCDYDFFKNLYRIEARKSLRNGMKRMLVVMTISLKSYIKDNDEVYDLVLEETSNTLKNVILSSLRLGDIVCKYSNRQFLILLDCDESSALSAIERIKDGFLAQERYERVMISYSFAPLAVAKIELDNDNILKIK